MKTWKQIESSRERRLWLTQVAIPTVMIGIAAYQIPEVRAKAREMKWKVQCGVANLSDKIRKIFRH